MGWRRHDEVSYLTRDRELADGAPFSTHHLPIVLQHGPTCGIAALSSIVLSKDPRADHVNTANSLLDAALDMGISIQGEIMSVWFMAKLAEWAGLNPEVVELEGCDITRLLTDSVLLVVYDKDKNHAPTTRYGGEHAHWLLVTGYSLQLPPTPSLPPHTIMLRRGTVKPGPPELHVFVQHGKSRLRQLWSWSEVLRSNDSVRRAKSGNYLVPENLHAHVAGRAVRIRLSGNPKE